MNVIAYIISLAISGLIVGALARLILPGKQNLSIIATIGLGIVGSIIGGTIGAILFGEGNFVGLVLSVLAGAGLLWFAERKGWARTTR